MKNYEKIKEEKIDEIDSICKIYIHKKSNAKICFVKNSDENKCFSIAFRTPPIDSSGLTHILEHSVLEGSLKYPVKDPFMELYKSSLNTFLNAFTFPDKTVYPFSSLNLKDFHNLMDFYLNSVFYPKIYDRKEIFLQEGWHYEIADKDSDITINGVVYNEMKGAFSDSEETLFRTIMHSLFKDTSYSLESGGDPKYIPTLSYDKFLDFHKKYYHPSNSYIYLYGNLNEEEELEFLDKEYLSKFEKNDFDTEIKYQIPYDKPVYEKNYFESDNDKAYLSYNISLPTSLDNKLNIAIEIILNILFNMPGAIIKDNLNKMGFGASVDVMSDDSLLQPIIAIYVSDADKNMQDEFIKALDNEFKKVIEEGLNKDTLSSILSYYEFKAREQLFSHTPRGLNVNLDILSSWIYDFDKPFLKLEEIKYFEELKKEINTDYFEKIIDKYILNNPHKSYVTLIGDENYLKNEDKKLKDKLKKFKKSLSDEEIDNLIKENQKLKEYQNTPSTKEELDTLPKLKLEDIKVSPINPNLEIINDKYEILFSDYKTNKIAYVSYYFNLDKLNIEDLVYLNLYKSLLLNLSTDKYNYKELNDLILSKSGGISSSINVYKDKNDEVKIKYHIDFSAIISNLDFVSSLVKNILFETKFDDKERIKNRLSEIRISLRNSIAARGSELSIKRASSHIFEHSMLNEKISGLSYIWFIDNLVNNFDKYYDKMKNKFEYIKSLFAKSNFILGICLEKEDFIKKKYIYDDFYESLNDKINYKKYEFKKSYKNEGFYGPYDVNFNSMIIETDERQNGTMTLLSNILSNSFLYNNVRVLGGAYGISFSMGDYNIAISSYRDPNIKSTYDNYYKIIEFLDNLNLSDEELLKYKIGTIGSLQLVLHNKYLAVYARSRYFAGKTYEDSLKTFDEILSSTNDDLKKLNEIIKKSINDLVITSIGSKKDITKDKKIFDEVKGILD